jgi:BCCT family betaine/carnitine transporter
LKKGIQVLSNINVLVVFGILLFVFITGPTVFMIKMGITSMGLIGQNFLRMSTWLDPVNNSGFPESWTVFYWGWWIISSPIIGMFIAKISKGRTVKQVISGAIIYGTLGCALVFMVLGNYGLYLQISETFDVISYLNEFGANATIFKILGMLKMGKVIVVLFTIGAMIFASTTFDSISYIIASCTTKSLDEDQEPARWNRLFWALILAFIPSVFILIDGPLKTIQSSSIIAVIPGIIILILLAISFLKMIKQGKYYTRE